MRPKVSILLGSYNQRDFIRQSVESALSQTYPNIEIIAHDNGSTDGTAEIIRSYASDPRLKLCFSRENISQTRSIMAALSESTGEFITILCGDDYYLPHKIQRQMECFDSLPPEFGLVYCSVYRHNVLTGDRWVEPCIKEDGFILRKMLLQYHTAGAISWISPLIRRECFARFPWHTDLSFEGESVFFRFALAYKFKFLDEPLAVMQDHNMNAGKAIAQCSNAAMLAFERLRQEPLFPKDMAHPVDIFLGRAFRNYGWQAVRFLEDRQWARDCFAQSIKRHRLQIFHPRTILGLCLSMAPQGALRAINRIAAKFIHHNEAVSFKTEL